MPLSHSALRLFEVSSRQEDRQQEYGKRDHPDDPAAAAFVTTAILWNHLFGTTGRDRLAETAEEIVRQEIEKQKIEIAAEAQAERIRREAKGEADGILMRFEAQAEGTKKLLEAKADGYLKLVDSCDGNATAAATLLMIEKMEELVKLQVEAISNLKIDKVTVWDSGGGNGQGSATANFASNLIKSIPPLHDVSSMVGIELPEYLGRMVDARVKDALQGESKDGGLSAEDMAYLDDITDDGEANGETPKPEA